MKEVKEIQLNDITGWQKFRLPNDVKFIAAYRNDKIKLVYEQPKRDDARRQSEYNFILIAPFDFVPATCLYIGTVPNEDSVFHIYLED